MKERPILFNTAMVQAILAGRKTQTRRVMSSSHAESVAYMGGSDDEGKEFKFAGLFYGTPIDDDGKELPDQWMTYCTEYPEEGSIPIGQGFGANGDRLWVRETWCLGRIDETDAEHPLDRHLYVEQTSTDDCLLYKADCLSDGINISEVVWRPSIHMPRTACRIILEITGLRVERLQDINAQDCAAEGHPLKPETSDDKSVHEDAAKDWFMDIWNSTGGDWNANPWVWVIEFKVLTVNGVVPEVAA